MEIAEFVLSMWKEAFIIKAVNGEEVVRIAIPIQVRKSIRF